MCVCVSVCLSVCWSVCLSLCVCECVYMRACYMQACVNCTAGAAHCQLISVSVHWLVSNEYFEDCTRQ